jgi:hypothetical protein
MEPDLLLHFSIGLMGFRSDQCKHGLITSRIRGQGYDGASNMQGHISSLKSLIVRESPSAFYVHYFAHQLQLTWVVIVKKYLLQVCSLFGLILNLLNVVWDSCKGMTCFMKNNQPGLDALENREIVNGRGLNQEINLKWHANTRCNFHYVTLVNLILMYSSVTVTQFLKYWKKINQVKMRKLKMVFQF